MKDIAIAICVGTVIACIILSVICFSLAFLLGF